MSRLLLPALLLLVALTGLLDWSGQRRQAARYQELVDQAAPHLWVQSAAVWARPALGGPPPPAPPLVLFRSLERWKLDPPELVGEELLTSGQAGAAAWVLLEEWLSITPGSGGRATRLELTRSEAQGPLQIEAELEGPPAAVLTWIRSLLAQPLAAGVLADPRRLDLRMDERLLRAKLIVRVWPVATLLEGSE